MINPDWKIDKYHQHPNFYFPHIAYQTSKSYKYDLSEEYQNLLVDKIERLKKEFYSTYEKLNGEELVDLYEKSNQVNVDFMKRYPLSILCKNHNEIDALKFDGNLTPSRIKFCKECIGFDSIDASLNTQDIVYNGAINSFVQKKIFKTRQELFLFINKQVKNSQWDQSRNIYHDYLNTPVWKNKRQKILERDNWLCQGCLEKKATDVHHLTYANIYNELMFQLISLCKECHKRIHADKEAA
jgi:hypothetical protein